MEKVKNCDLLYAEWLTMPDMCNVWLKPGDVARIMQSAAKKSRTKWSGEIYNLCSSLYVHGKIQKQGHHCSIMYRLAK